LKKKSQKTNTQPKAAPGGRRHPRVNTFFPNEFKHHSNHSEEIEGKANVLNISEAGLFANQIIAFNLETGKIVNEPDLAERELHAIKFSLNGSLKLIETKGRCIWQKRKGKDLCIGIRFKDMSKVHKDMIRNYVYESIQSKDKP
jgi:c-di-GMP-binding flagellar brake protein YcgR